MRQFTVNLINEIISNYENADSMRISMIVRGKCYICNDKRLTPLDIHVTYENSYNSASNLSRRVGWIHCKRCTRYVQLHRYYKSPFSLEKKINGTIPIRFMRKCRTPHKYGKGTIIGLQNAELGTKLYDDARDYKSGEPITPSPMCTFTIMENNNFVPWTGKTFTTSFLKYKRDVDTTIYGVVNWIPARHGKYGHYIRKKYITPEDYLPNSKLIPLPALILFNRNLFGYKPEESKIIPGHSPHWKHHISKDYNRANAVERIWTMLLWCLEKKNIKIPPTPIMMKIFKSWYSDTLHYNVSV